MEMISILFEAVTPYGMYRDALYFPEDNVPPDEEIERLKQQRIDNWIALVSAPQEEMPGQPNEIIAGNYTDG